MADRFLTFTEHYANPERDPSCGEELFLWDGQDGSHGEAATPAFVERRPAPNREARVASLADVIIFKEITLPFSCPYSRLPQPSLPETCSLDPTDGGPHKP